MSLKAVKNSYVVAVVLYLACTAYGINPSDPFSSTADSVGAKTRSVELTGQEDKPQKMFVIRSPKDNFGLEKRQAGFYYDNKPGEPRLPKYNFGVGKRGSLNVFDNEDETTGNGLIERELQRSGKRASEFDYGLAKRGDEEEKKKDRYNFGLGRR
ncbi:helicostatins-like [Uranotaenia lowii]|uniref:helicostatins-like n=1 Tax=Uranotaenia lowii TaxID=190385 RepID=UPI00247AB697|nr:helicostatins-like [Uranotaenia lowii]